MKLQESRDWVTELKSQAPCLSRSRATRTASSSVSQAHAVIDSHVAAWQLDNGRRHSAKHILGHNTHMY